MDIVGIDALLYALRPPVGALSNRKGNKGRTVPLCLFKAGELTDVMCGLVGLHDSTHLTPGLMDQRTKHRLE